jgi:hypothetical protein
MIIAIYYIIKERPLAGLEIIKKGPSSRHLNPYYLNTAMLLKWQQTLQPCEDALRRPA